MHRCDENKCVWKKDMLDVKEGTKWKSEKHGGYNEGNKRNNDKIKIRKQ